MFLTIIVFIIILGVLVFVHEFGHFITAKKAGIKVDEFGFGFPPRLGGVQKLSKEEQARTGKTWKFFWHRHDTEKNNGELNSEGRTIYSLNWIPLGGFVKIKGESGEFREDADSFGHKSFFSRALVLSAGVIMNVILAFVIFSFGLMSGLPSVIDESQINDKNIREVKVQVAEIAKNSKDMVISAGGGVVLNDQNMQNLKKGGVTIWLCSTLKTKKF